VADPLTGENLADAGEVLTRERAKELSRKGVNEAVVTADGRQVKVFSNGMVDMKHFLDFDPEEYGVTEQVRFDVLRELLSKYSGPALKDAVAERIADLIPKQSSWTTSWPPSITFAVFPTDWRDTTIIDHLGNRRLRAVWASCCRTSSASVFPYGAGDPRGAMTIQDLDI
jgi:DNA-directed RNA polymerase subunit beta